MLMPMAVLIPMRMPRFPNGLFKKVLCKVKAGVFGLASLYLIALNLVYHKKILYKALDY